MKFRFLLLLIFFLIEGTLVGAACKKPTITVPIATPDTSGQQVTITWTTNVAANSAVSVGLAAAGILSAVTDTAGVTSHSVTVTGLLPSVLYGWGVVSTAIYRGSPCTGGLYTASYGGSNNETFTTPAAPAGTFDYYLVPDGPQHVTQGYNLYYAIQAGALVGTYTGNSLTVVLTGLPNNTSITWVDSPQLLDYGPNTVSTTTIPNDTMKYYQLLNTEILIQTNSGGTTTPGTYTITMTGSGSGIPTHTATWTITVDSATSPFGITFPYGTPSSYPAIPDLAMYEASAFTHGTYNCAEDLDATPRTIRPNDTSNLTGLGDSDAGQKGAWYYDGVRVYNNITAMLGDSPMWQQCITNVKAVYQPWITANGGVNADATLVDFPQGTYIDYLQTGDPNDLTMINDFDARTYNPSFGVMVPVRYLQREAAYSLKAGIFASLLSQNNPRVGQSTSFWMAYHLDHTLGHVDQICLSQNATYFEYFMTGLEADALIDYYTLISHDPRIPSAIKCLADYIFTNGWNAIPLDPNTFPYDVYRFHVGAAAAPSDSMTPLNQLISPMYAWLFMMTGNSTYQTEGDAIWDQGVTYAGEEASNGYNSAACCEGIGAPPQSGGNAGKVFSQNYMWGTSYVTWRSPPGTVKSNQLNRPAPPSGLSAIVH